MDLHKVYRHKVNNPLILKVYKIFWENYFYHGLECAKERDLNNLLFLLQTISFSRNTKRRLKQNSFHSLFHHFCFDYHIWFGKVESDIDFKIFIN